MSSSGKVGMKMITSPLYLGLDNSRTELIKQIEKYSNQEIYKTTMLFRYEDGSAARACSLVLPNATRSFSFVVLCRAKNNGRIFGTFSEKMNGRTFVFTVKEPNTIFFFSDEAYKSAPVCIKGKHLCFGSE